MTPDDPRHGTYAGYIAWCREECCRRAARDYQRQRYFDRAVLDLPPRHVPKLGSVRRVHALQALGWSAEHLSQRLGHSRAYLNVAMNRNERRGIHQDTARKIAALYDELSMTFPPETHCTARQRRIAKERGWLPPLAWDEDAIDDPMVIPKDTGYDRKFNGTMMDIDPVVIERVLAGDVRVHTTPAEKREVVRRWPGPLNELERLTGWNARRYVTKSVSVNGDSRDLETEVA